MQLFLFYRLPSECQWLLSFFIHSSIDGRQWQLKFPCSGAIKHGIGSMKYASNYTQVPFHFNILGLNKTYHRSPYAFTEPETFRFGRSVLGLIQELFINLDTILRDIYFGRIPMIFRPNFACSRDHRLGGYNNIVIKYMVRYVLHTKAFKDLIQCQ